MLCRRFLEWQIGVVAFIAGNVANFVSFGECSTMQPEHYVRVLVEEQPAVHLHVLFVADQGPQALSYMLQGMLLSPCWRRLDVCSLFPMLFLLPWC